MSKTQSQKILQGTTDVTEDFHATKNFKGDKYVKHALANELEKKTTVVNTDGSKETGNAGDWIIECNGTVSIVDKETFESEYKNVALLARS